MSPEKPVIDDYCKGWGEGLARGIESPDLVATFFLKLLDGQGSIVSSNVCSIDEISMAREDGRFFIDDRSFGYVYRPEPADSSIPIPTGVSICHVCGEMLETIPSEPPAKRPKFWRQDRACPNMMRGDHQGNVTYELMERRHVQIRRVEVMKAKRR